MNKRISLLVAIGFALLIGLGSLTSVFLITGLNETIVRSRASHSSALEVRAAVRSLRADYLEMGEAVRMASEEVAAATHAADAKATETVSLAWLMFGLFLLVGTVSGVVLSFSVRTIARRFEHAAADVAEQRDHLQTVMTAIRDALVVVDAA